MVILDTCAIIEILKPNPSFTKKTLRIMEDGVFILSISFAEIACKVKTGKLEMNISSRELFREFKETQNVEIIDIGVNEWLDSVELIWDENRDPADRVITAFAIKHERPIVTSNKKIADFYHQVIW